MPDEKEATREERSQLLTEAVAEMEAAEATPAEEVRPERASLAKLAEAAMAAKRAFREATKSLEKCEAEMAGLKQAQAAAGNDARVSFDKLRKYMESEE